MEANKKKGDKVHYFDYSLLAIVIFLMCFGLVMLYSTSSYDAQLNFNAKANNVIWTTCHKSIII